MFSKTWIEKEIATEDGTTRRSLDNANRVMYGGGYELDGFKISTRKNSWVVVAHFAHNRHGDHIEHTFTGFDLNTRAGAMGLDEFFEMFNVHPYFNPHNPTREFVWGIYSDYRDQRDKRPRNQGSPAASC